MPVIVLDDPQSQGLSDPKAINQNEAIKYHQHVCNKIAEIRNRMRYLRLVVQNLTKLGDIPDILGEVPGSMAAFHRRMLEIDFLEMAQQCFQLERCTDITQAVRVYKPRRGQRYWPHRRMGEFTEPFSASKIKLLEHHEEAILLKTTSITGPGPYFPEVQEGTLMVISTPGCYFYDLKTKRDASIEDFRKNLELIKNYNIKPILKTYLPVVDSVSEIVVSYFCSK